MLIPESRLINIPIMGLQTGTKLASTKRPIIDPSNLKIIAYEVEGPLLVDKPSLLRIDDVRELGEIGMIIDSNDEFIGLSDVIKIEKIYNLNFNLIGISVIDEMKRKIGKVDSYNVDTGSFTIQQLNVRQGLIKSLTNTGLLIHRSQIIEINNQSIVIKSSANKVISTTNNVNKMSFVNPFRASAPQPDGLSTNSDA